MSFFFNKKLKLISRSIDIEEKINSIEWLRPIGKNQFVLTTNDKSIKLWKLSDKPLKKSESTNKRITTTSDVKIPKLKIIDDGVNPIIKKVFPNLHGYHINGISSSPNGENIISSDDLKIYLWDFESTDIAYNIVDIKPENFDELNEVITTSKFHPISDTQFAYATSKGIINIGDMRSASNLNKPTLCFSNKEETAQRNFFTDIVSSISDIEYSKNGRYIFARDFLTVKVWDINMTKKPVCINTICEPLKSKLCELYENEGIFEKFNVS